MGLRAQGLGLRVLGFGFRFSGWGLGGFGVLGWGVGTPAVAKEPDCECTLEAVSKLCVFDAPARAGNQSLTSSKWCKNAFVSRVSG